ncbi:hypothetical protein PLUTO_00560 [Luteibacter phage vB_LflM-Pluto]|uniref:Uncharacterized protein n=1 Tax=Luteibacter phage vB_LflM-Pluto TaxID=2948611 RepID=A0A9E7MV50_9CAUD|nr:hypothetical protein PLUTO_00560 [Luteibacter phage vB_LflM-Pluto]
MSEFRTYKAWSTCVRLRYPKAAIVHESRNPPTREVTHVVARESVVGPVLAEWDSRAQRGTVNPVVTRPFS